MKRVPKPSPAIVVALLALVLAVAGTATAALTGKDKRKVRSIADQEIAKAAPGLAVSSAQSAQNAQSAQSAQSAQNSQSAQDAAALGGIAPGGFARVFTGAADASSTANQPIFSVPQLGVTILAKTSSPATAAVFKVRNDNPTASIVVGTNADDTMGILVTHGATSAEIPGTSSPVLVTVDGKPNTILQVTCAIGATAGRDLVCEGVLGG